jgi:periplasmic copper chaperone A
MWKSHAFSAAAIAAFVLGIGAARADENKIRIDEAWARATPGIVQTGAVYLSITNHGTAPDQLLAIRTPVAARAELHEMKMVNNVMEMRPIRSLSIAPGQKLVLAPGGYHIMLIGLKAPLMRGQSVPLTLTFAHAGTQDVVASVAKVGAMHPDEGGSAHNGSGMPSMPGMAH